ncbi:MAG: calcium-binding protein [Cyanobacteria bacterium P01_F01_bin.150]
MGSAGFNIQIDYRFAGEDLSDQNKQKIEEAARIWESFIADDFEDIPAGTELPITNPSTGNVVDITLSEAIDDVLIFVGVQSLSGDALAEAGPETFVGEARTDGADFQPYVGTMTLNKDISFVSVDTILHEMAHVLGFGTSDIFSQKAANLSFDGATVRAVNNNSPIPLTSDEHIESTFKLANGLIPTMNPADGASGLPTVIDLALLADIGYEIPALANAAVGAPVPVVNHTLQGTDGDDGTLSDQLPLAGLNGADTILGGKGNDVIMGAYIHLTDLDSDSDDRLDGGEGNDTIEGGGGDDLIIGGPGNDELYGEGITGEREDYVGELFSVTYSPTGKDTFAFHLGSGADIIHDFGVDYDFIQIDPGYGFSTPADLLNQLTTVQSLSNNRTQSTLDLGNGNQITINHDKPLTEANFRVESVPTLSLETAPSTSPSSNTSDNDNNDSPHLAQGSDGPDRLFGNENTGDRILGGEGNDRIRGLSGPDRLVGGNGNDRLFGDEDNDTLLGNNGNDKLVGGDGDDKLKGGRGRDRLDGGLGDDVLIGGGGRDRFFLREDEGTDIIRGFRLDQDILKFRGIQPADVDFFQDGNDTIISLGNEDLAIVKNIDALDLKFFFD